jgi:hypothetical protein
MISLKSLIPSLAKAVGMSPNAVYERQRALVRAGLLKPRPGRGPGSGVPATAHSLAMLLISLLAPTGLSDVEEQTRIVANLKSIVGGCPLTGKKTFGAALADVLDSADLRSVRWITIERRGTKTMAEMVFKTEEQYRAERQDPERSTHPESSRFGAEHLIAEKYNLQVRVTFFLYTAVLEAAIRFHEEQKK